MSSALPENLRALEERRADLMRKLDSSLALRAFYPEAFEHGGCRSHVVGAPASGFRYVVVRGDGSRREWPVSEVPLPLWERCVSKLDEHHPLAREIKRRRKLEAKGAK